MDRTATVYVAKCYCRQPEHLKLDLTENSLTCDLLSKFKSFSTNLVHLELVCQWSSTQGLLTDLTWLQGVRKLAVLLQWVSKQCFDVLHQPMLSSSVL